MNAADVMTPDVITVHPDTPLDQVVTLMLASHISGVPVMDEDSLVGIISEGDLLRRIELGTQPRRSHLLEAFSSTTSLAAEYTRTRGRKASEVMTTDVVSVEDTAPVSVIVEVMETYHIKRVPVLCDGKLVGIVSRANLLRALASKLQAVPDPLPNDRRIRMTVFNELQEHKWGGRVAQLDVTVQDGVVTLWGMVSSEEQRTAVRVAAENVPGVTRVVDRLENVMEGAMVPIA
ncbi:MAG TPA: CBS domain-containing protein [Acetobacteraceae bacterium]|jgi:CBS domain-containing protein|nr:CBS domain-containing protein [Acetobacteraceae bacterium]